MDYRPSVATSNAALREAAGRGDINTVQSLLATSDVDINATDGYGRTALILATCKGSITTACALLAKTGVNINAVDGCDRTALILAAYKGRTAIAQILLTKPEININLIDAFGRTALIWAARNDHTPIVHRLLATPGIKVNIADHEGITAFTYAHNRRNQAMVAALKYAFMRDALMESYRQHFALNDAQAWAATLPEVLALHHLCLPDQDVTLFLIGFVTPLNYKEAKTLLPFLKQAHAVHRALKGGVSLEKALALILSPKASAATMPCNTTAFPLATVTLSTFQGIPSPPRAHLLYKW